MACVLSIGTDLDDLEHRNGPYFAFFTEFWSFFSNNSMVTRA